MATKKQMMNAVNNKAKNTASFFICGFDFTKKLGLLAALGGKCEWSDFFQQLGAVECSHKYIEEDNISG